MSIFSCIDLLTKIVERGSVLKINFIHKLYNIFFKRSNAKLNQNEKEFLKEIIQDLKDLNNKTNEPDAGLSKITLKIKSSPYRN